ncbi:MAG: cytochrome c3 family protein [Candidatus Omnitrophota bacterium]
MNRLVLVVAAVLFLLSILSYTKCSNTFEEPLADRVEETAKQKADSDKCSEEAVDCLKCHVTAPECHSDMKISDKKVTGQVCYPCHTDKETIKQIKDRDRIHKTHIFENKMTCVKCHDFTEKE